MKSAIYPVIMALMGLCLSPLALAQMDCPPGLAGDIESAGERIQAPEPNQGNLASTESSGGVSELRLVRHQADGGLSADSTGRASSVQ